MLIIASRAFLHLVQPLRRRPADTATARTVCRKLSRAHQQTQRRSCGAAGKAGNIAPRPHRRAKAVSTTTTRYCRPPSSRSGRSDSKGEQIHRKLPSLGRAPLAGRAGRA